MSRVIVVGAGLSGLACARRLGELRPELDVQVVDKGRGVGGRMATRRMGDARFDHGAQFFTTRSNDFSALIADAVAAGAVVEWTRGFEADPDGYPRWCGAQGMTSLAKWMVSSADLDVDLGTTMVDLREHPAAAYVVTAPIPQAMAILSFSHMLPPPPTAAELAALEYKPTIAVMVKLAGSPQGFADHGGVQLADHPSLGFIADNERKGVSPVPAVTIHLSNALSGELWVEPDEVVVARALAETAAFVELGELLETQVQRWRYAGPVECHPERTVSWTAGPAGSGPLVAMAGEMFGGPKVEGAYLSGCAAAVSVAAALD